MVELRDIEVRTTEDQSGPILALLRAEFQGLSWSQARKWLTRHHVGLNGVVCVDEGRRVRGGELFQVSVKGFRPPPSDRDVRICHVDNDIIVCEKPSGMITLRRSEEQGWPSQRKLLAPTLDECVPRLVARHAAERKGNRLRQGGPRLAPVHRIDRDTSGLVLFARNEIAQQRIIEQFAAHTAGRRYLCIVPGQPEDQTITSRFIRDRGDGLRGSTNESGLGQDAVTHVRTLRCLGAYSELECRLKTGRTNQIRIHLAEAGYPVCGDLKYRGPFGQSPKIDTSDCPRLALHSAALEFEHPQNRRRLQFESTWPLEILKFLVNLTDSNSVDVRQESMREPENGR